MYSFGVKSFVLANAKMLVAVVASTISWLTLRKGVQLPPDVVAALSALVVTALVWLTPNTPAIPVTVEDIKP